MSRVTIFNSIEFYSYERFVELFSCVLYIYTHLYVYIYLYFFLRIRLLEMKAFAVDSEIFLNMYLLTFGRNILLLLVTWKIV